MKYYQDFNVLHVIVNPTTALNKTIIVDGDFDSIAGFINEKLSFYFGGRLCFSDLKLSRIDYKLDIKTPYKDIYVNILKKLRYTYCRRTQINYDTSTYYKGKSYNLNLYDKEAKEATGLRWKDFEDVLRLEIQLKSRHLRKLMKDGNYGLEPTLQNYFCNSIRTHMFNDILAPLLYKGDYYTTRKSRFVLEKLGHSASMMDKLLLFQKNVFEYGITGAISLSDKSGNTVRGYIARLQDAGVNPIPLPKNCRVNHLANLLTYLHEK